MSSPQSLPYGTSPVFIFSRSAHDFSAVRIAGIAGHHWWLGH